MAARAGGETWPPHSLRIAAALLVLLAIVSAAQASHTALFHPNGSIDLGMTLKAAQALLHENPYERYLAGRGSAPLGYSAVLNPFPMVAIHVPSALMLLWPYSGLSWPAAKLAWLLSNFVFTFGALLLALRRFLPHRQPLFPVIIASVLLMSFPWRVTVGNGQHLMMSLFFFLLAAELADRGHRAWAGISLAASFLKYTAILFLLPYFVLKRQWTALLTGLGIHWAMTVAIAVWLQEQPWVLIEQAIRASRTNLLSGHVDLFALADRLGAPLELAAIIGLGLTATALAIAFRRPQIDESRYLAGLCVLSLLVVYHRAYDAVILLIPLLFALTRPTSERPVAILVFALVGCSWFLDRVVLEFTPGLGGQGLMWTSGYYYFVAFLFYATLWMLLCRPLLTRRTECRQDSRRAG